MNHYYKDAKSWNPFKGCEFDCIYCKKSFQLQAKRQKHRCIDCYNYTPHLHSERLNRIPKADLVVACGNGDISFADFKQKALILRAMQLKPKQTFLLQTKNPSCLHSWRIPSNVIVGTTIETNRDTSNISKAPRTELRYMFLKKIIGRKAVTIEPILDFDMKILKEWIWKINPEIVWVGYANHTNGLNLDEPELSKTQELIFELNRFTDVRLKTIRDKLICN